MDPDFSRILATIIVGTYTMATIRVDVVTEDHFGDVLDDILSLAAGCAAGGLTYLALGQ